MKSIFFIIRFHAVMSQQKPQFALGNFTDDIFIHNTNLLFRVGLSMRLGISDITTTALFLLRATLSINCRISSLHCSNGCVSILFDPAARTVTSLLGIWRIRTLIWRAVIPGYTKPVALNPFPSTRGATPLTMELPTTVTVTGSAPGPVRRHCCRLGAGWSSASTEKRLCVLTDGTASSWLGAGTWAAGWLFSWLWSCLVWCDWLLGLASGLGLVWVTAPGAGRAGPGNEGGQVEVIWPSLIVSINFLRSQLRSSRDAIFLL